MEPAKGSSTPPKPTSGLKVIGHVRRVHLKRYHFPHFVPLTAAVMACDGLCKRYIEVNGPDSLMPNRKEPLTNEIISVILDLFRTSTTLSVQQPVLNSAFSA
jgi:hypothetical protein